MRSSLTMDKILFYLAAIANIVIFLVIIMEESCL